MNDTPRYDGAIPVAGHRFKTGERLRLTYDGRTVDASVLLASGNGYSLMLSFEALLGGYVGQMPVLLEDDGAYRDLLKGQLVQLELAQ